MTPLRFDPNSIPGREILTFVPKFRGASGSPTFEATRIKDQVSLGVRAQLGLLLFKNALSFEAKSRWRREGEIWTLLDYQEINHKSSRSRSSEEGIAKARAKGGAEQIMDPASFLYALRQNPMREVGDRRIGYGARLESPITIEFSVGDVKSQVVKPLGSDARKILKLEMLIETPKSTEKVPILQDGRSSFWIDQETNMPVEISYELPPFGSLTIAIDKVERS